jgi:formamidopyrimidine-DNA glycosylase
VPELPEVETVRRGLAPVMEGHVFARVEQRRKDLRFPLPARFKTRLEGRRLVRLDRRAKYLVGHLDNGEVLAMHLGMSGRFSILAACGGGEIGAFTYDTGADPKHDHIVFHMSSGAIVTYNDPRRFGFMDLIANADLATHKLFRAIGIEPLGDELTPAFLAQEAVAKKTDLKAFLLDQRIVCGLGNIYVCEALFRARLSPVKSARSLSFKSGKPTDKAERLVPEIRAVLEAAIQAGGSTLRDYRHADGALGYFQHAFQVYGRAGEACVRAGCDGIVKRRVQSGRSTFYCPSCQR